jgi:hypothetical protein
VRLQLGDRFQVLSTLLLLAFLVVSRPGQPAPRLVREASRELACRYYMTQISLSLDASRPRLSRFYYYDTRLAALARNGDRRALGYLMQVTPKVGRSWGDVHSALLCEALIAVGDERFASEADQQSAYCKFMMLMNLSTQMTHEYFLGNYPHTFSGLQRSTA